MSKSLFASKIISNMKAAISTNGGGYNGGTASMAMQAVADAITEYIMQNTQVMISYVGTMTSFPPSPDPVVTDTFKVIGKCAPPPPSNSFDAWFLQIQQNIIAGFQLAPMGNAGVAFPQKPFLAPAPTVNQSALKSSHNVQDSDPQQKMWEIVCQGLMDWINMSAMNPAPMAATRASGPSAGVGAITKITIT